MLHNKKLIAAAALAGALALFGCSASSESTTTVETSVTTDGVTETTTTETTTTTDGSGTSTETNTTSSTTLDISTWEYGWYGVSDKGSTVYYAESPAGDQALIVIEDESLDGLFSCVGTISMNDDGISTIEDLNGGPSFGFKLVDQNDENATFYLGEDFGTVVLKPYDMGEFIGALKDIDDGTLFGA